VLSFGLACRERKDEIGGIAQSTQRFAFAELDRLVEFQGPGHGRFKKHN